MPPRIPKPCRKPRCENLSTERHGYCGEHKALASNWEDDRRGSSTERGYGGMWRKRRVRILKRDKGLCQVCIGQGRITAASSVDHIINKAEGGTDDDSNLQAICWPCHKIKTQDESVRGLRRTR